MVKFLKTYSLQEYRSHKEVFNQGILIFNGSSQYAMKKGINTLDNQTRVVTITINLKIRLNWNHSVDCSTVKLVHDYFFNH